MYIQVISALHLIGHFGAVISMSLGAVSFTHIVKVMHILYSEGRTSSLIIVYFLQAAEPVFSTVLSGIILGKWSHWQVSRPSYKAAWCVFHHNKYTHDSF